jgi:uncharacterized membrane protein (DUF373 family)
MSTPKFVRLVRAYEYFERVIVITLLALLMVVVLWATVAMGIGIGASLVARLTTGTVVEHSPLADVLSRMSILHEVFGGFLLILIGVELMKTVVMYLSQHELHVEVVFTVAMIAIARHAIDIDPRDVGGTGMLGMSALVITLALAYYLFRRSTAAGGDPGRLWPGGEATTRVENKA